MYCVYKGVAQGHALTAMFKACGEYMNRGVNSAFNRYYRLRYKGFEPTEFENSDQVWEAIQDILPAPAKDQEENISVQEEQEIELEAETELEPVVEQEVVTDEVPVMDEETRTLEERVHLLEQQGQQLSEVFRFLADGMELTDKATLDELERLREENQALAYSNTKLLEENKELEHANKRLAENLAKSVQQFKEAQEVFEMFTNMASISQIMSLGDFKQQMVTIYDRWGTVVDMKFVPDNKSVGVG